MYSALMNFFLTLFNDIASTGDFDYILDIYQVHTELGAIGLVDYMAFICSTISLVFIVVLCCLFVYKIIKLVGGLIR